MSGKQNSFGIMELIFSNKPSFLWFAKVQALA